jgi:molybdate transport system substrate-binding protein
MRLSLVAAAACLSLLAACGGADAEPVVLTVSAAASLTGAFTELGAAFEEQHPGVNVVFNFGSSSALRAQLVEGAQVDVFASADWAQMRLAEEAGAVSGALAFASNSLVIIAPADNPAGITSPDDLARPGLKLVLAAPAVPVGAYAREALALMAAEYGADFPARVEANLVSLEDSVRGVAGKVALGEADAGIVYVTDALAQPGLAMIPIPPDFNIVAEYPLALSPTARQPVLAAAFIDLVLSEAGREILARWGFEPPSLSHE